MYKFLTILLLCLPGFAQDGHLKFNFSAPIGGYFLPGFGGGEASVNFATCCGKFYVFLDPKQGYSGLHSVRFKTGPLVAGTYSLGAQFGEGGQFDLVSGEAPFLPCSAAKPCSYSGKWLWSAITVLEQPDGSHIYRFEGMLSGTYSDMLSGTRHHIRAHYQQESLDWLNLFGVDDGSQQSWGIGSLQVILSEQGAR